MPRFAAMPVPWHRGSAIDNQPYQLAAYVGKSHTPYIYSCVLGALWRLQLYVSSDIAIQATSYNMCKIGLTGKGLDALKQAIPGLENECGIKIKDPQTESWRTDFDDTASLATTGPSEWGLATAVYAINVPLWHDAKAVRIIYSVTGQKDFVHSISRWLVGEIRTTTWKIIGPSVEQTVGCVLKAMPSRLWWLPSLEHEHQPYFLGAGSYWWYQSCGGVASLQMSASHDPAGAIKKAISQARTVRLQAPCTPHPNCTKWGHPSTLTWNPL